MDENLMDFDYALELTLAAVEPLPPESVLLSQLAGRVAAADVMALVDVPSTDVSLKDGYAVRSTDMVTEDSSPVQLNLIGRAAAGRPFTGELSPGSAVRVLSGASIPQGADAVLAEEITLVEGRMVTALSGAEPGMDILRRGADMAAGQRIIAAGTFMRPAQVGLLAAAGHARLDVVRQPRVAVLAVGDELVRPGDELRPGMVYTSNQATIAAWCAHFGIRSEVAIVGDDSAAIERQLLAAQKTCDAIITTGGAWGSERDRVVTVLDRLGWRRLYHHVRLKPGKAVGCGLWGGKIVFCLPGGPTASQMAFLQLALPALLRLAGHLQPHLPWLVAELAEDVTGQANWTHFIEGRVVAGETGMQFYPRKMASRLQSMADAEGLVMIPAGAAALRKGTTVRIQLLPGVPQSQPGLSGPQVNSPATDTGRAARSARAPVVSFVARSGAGKTTFLEQLIPELVARGLRVGVMKHHAHPTPFDVPGKDTYRLSQAGARVVVGACSVQVAVFRQEDGYANLEAIIARDLSDVDLVLTEGFKHGTYPKIEVHRKDHDPELLCVPGELLALVSDEWLEVDTPQFALTDVAGVAAFLCDWAQAET